MKRRTVMTAAAGRALTSVLDLAPADRVLVVTDPQTAECGEAFLAAARALGCPTRVYRLPATGRPLQAVPPDLPPLLAQADVVVNAIVGDPEEVPFRLRWLALVEGSGRHRLGHSPGIDAEMMLGGALDVDYAEMGERAARLLAALRGAVAVHLTSPAGTDLRLDLRGRVFHSDLKATLTAGANLPCGEIYTAPVETAGEGRLVVDGGFVGHGVLELPVVITVAGGRAVAVESADPVLQRTVTHFLDTDEGARNVAELGLGLNPGARLGSHILESEKVRGTVHVAFGDNDGLAGGQSRSRMHMDYLVLAPTLAAQREDGAWQVVLRDGAAVA